MKIQDIAFLISLAILFSIRKPRLFVIAGIVSLLFSIPLFAQWIFFTAQRLTWYAFAFFAIAVLMNLLERKNNS